MPPAVPTAKLSDFERWQLEQNANDERKRRQRAANPIAVARRIDSEIQMKWKSPTPPLIPQPPQEINSDRSSIKQLSVGSLYI